jgi:hypothetical protein
MVAPRAEVTAGRALALNVCGPGGPGPQRSPLLPCSFTAFSPSSPPASHTTWSDGSPTLTELVDVYGRHGFGVLCIAVATGDFHRLEHLETWKTLLPYAKTEQAMVAYLRSTKTAYVVAWHLRDEPRRRIAA